jgi:hypothetical protein
MLTYLKRLTVSRTLLAAGAGRSGREDLSERIEEILIRDLIP